MYLAPEERLSARQCLVLLAKEYVNLGVLIYDEKNSGNNAFPRNNDVRSRNRGERSDP